MDIFDAMTLIRISNDDPKAVSVHDLNIARAVLEEKIKPEGGNDE